MGIHARDHDISAEMILQKYSYDRDTGTFTNRKTGRMMGKNRHGYGYVTLPLDGGRTVQAHRAVWLIEHGSMPERGMVVDHVNGKMKDNRVENLRTLTHSDNVKNTSWRRAGERKPNGVIAYNKKRVIEMHESGMSAHEISQKLRERRYGPFSENWVKKTIEEGIST